ncbi:MAG: SAM-dependent methyltransferase, partial [Planctomycetota bacterium]
MIRESAVDLNGEPLPWYTYPTIEYLKSLDLRDKIVFEWGCGNSSHFWATRCKQVFSCESDERWYDRVVGKKAKNQEIFLCKDEDSYVKQIEQLDSRFDIVVIDGKFRKSCAEQAIDYLNDGGIIILDNSDWYPETADFLRSKCFFQ